MDAESGSSRHNNLKSICILQDQCSEPQNLSLQYLKEITNDFSDERLLGQGGFGKVYKGVLRNGDMIAVKKLTWTMTGIQDKQYENEARHLMRLKHPNIVQLVGYCSETEKELALYKGKYVYAEKSERLLCLEYLPKGSLCGHLSGSDEYSGLDWDTRYKIIKGICHGLHYLHEEWQASTPIIHTDLKPSNILLDDNMVPKIADFGLSRLLGELQTRTITKNHYGTLGYMSPEYIDRGIITKELDIFSLGVIIIEIMTGNKHYPDQKQEEFIELVLKKWRNRLEKIPGSSLEFDCKQIRRCIEIGLICIKLDRTERPTTRQIIKMLAECRNEREVPLTEPLDSQLSLDHLEVIKVIGKGGSKTVQLVRHKFTGQFFAMKVSQLSIEDSKRRQIAEELKISLSVQCQYVVMFHQYFYFNGALSIVLEYMTGGSLADLLKTVKTIPEDYLAAICKQILKGLIYLHNEKNIIHRDLKPSNILINHRGEVKISDFGVSAIVSSSSEQRDTFTGTFCYMAPERICGIQYDYMSDIWSLGLVILECATGSFPLHSCVSFYELLEAIVEQPPPTAPSDQFSPEFCSFISACMQKTANDRSSAQVLLDHPFLSMYNGLHIDFASFFTTAGSPLAVPRTFNSRQL